MVRIGFVGAGMMGNFMALNLMNAGFFLTVLDKNRDAYLNLLSEGAREASNGKDLASNSDVIISMVNDDEATYEVFTGSEGVGEGARHGQIAVVMSTIDPGTVKEIAERIPEISFLDAPVSGGPVKAKDASLTIMVGGDKGSYEKCRTILGAMGSQVFYAGQLGSALTIKLINNVLGLGNLLMTIEELSLAQSAGLDLSQVARILKVSSGSNFYVLDWPGTKDVFDYLTEDIGRLDSLLQTFIKDVELAERFAENIHFNAPMIQVVKEAAKRIKLEDCNKNIKRLIS